MKFNQRKYILKISFVSLILLMLAFCGEASAQVKLPAIFTDHMVLQRDKPVNIWGWAKAGEKIRLTFNGQKVKTKVAADGKWEASLKPMAFGGPFDLIVKSTSGERILKDILIGDVWFCSGQSNMEMPLAGWGKVKNYEEEIAQGNHPTIRLFTVEKARSFKPEQDFKGNWQVCSPASVGEFSATAYFFARKLNKELNIPIGLVSSNWGGTNIQTWISWDAIKNRPKYQGQELSDFPKMVSKWAVNRKKYEEALTHDPGLSEKWFLAETDTHLWNKIELPKGFEQSEIGNVDGIVWFRKEIILSKTQAEAPALLSLGVIDDYDETYINGQLVGETDNWYTKRNYTLKKGILKPGKNTIAVKVLDRAGGGGFASSSADMFLKMGTEQADLSGDWLFRSAVTTALFDVKQDGANTFPSQLYNAMVAPIISFPIKGVIWYQGEENTNYPAGYADLFQMLIKNWRAKWGDELPFIWAQLANFMDPSEVPQETPWAIIREDQHKTLALPKTGEAVLIDLGEARDIHPKNKQDVGLRLALSALKVAYGENLAYSGPVLKSHKIEEGKFVFDFDQVYGGLVAKGNKYGYLKGFAIAGADHHFEWAKAFIRGNQVIVYSEKITNPIAVRYAWGNNPDDANLYNKASLPASPFRTDDW